MLLHVFSLVPRNINTSHLFLNLCTGYPLEQELISKYCSWFIKHYMAPQYITDMLITYTPARTLRSTGSGDLLIPRTRSKEGEAAFSVYAPQKWTIFPDTVRHATSVAIFKNRLKTYLYSTAICWTVCVHVSMCGCVSGCACMSLSVVKMSYIWLFTCTCTLQLIPNWFLYNCFYCNYVYLLWSIESALCTKCTL